MAGEQLRVSEGKDSGALLAVEPELLIGRAAEVPEGRLGDDPELSRRHARAVRGVGGELTIEDLGSANGTFVDGDEIHSPAHLLPDGQLLVGVTVLQLKTAEEVEAGGTSVRPIPESLAGLRPLPSEPERSEVVGTTIRRVPGFAIEEQRPDYVPDDLITSQSHQSELFALHDSKTKKMARHAPFALALLVIIVVMIYLGVR